MKQKRVTVVRGGPSDEYDVSMRTGRAVIDALVRKNYHVSDVVITKQGEWLESGRHRPVADILSATDVVFIAMHGAYGEDGTIQHLFERYHVPFTGSNSFPSKVAFNKDITKRMLASSGIKMPRHARITTDDMSHLKLILTTIQTSFASKKFVVKPLMSGSSCGVLILDTHEALLDSVTNILVEYDACMVEEFIVGTETTTGILAQFRNENLYALPPIEIIPAPQNAFFDYQAKYDGSTDEICPARFSYEMREKISNIARTVHATIGLSQYSRSDMIVAGEDVYFLEVNTLPGLTTESLLPKAALAIGLGYDDLIAHLIETATVRP